MPPAQALLGSLPISIYTSIGTQYGLSLLAQYQADAMSSSGKEALQLLSQASRSAEQFIIVGAAGSIAGAAGDAVAADLAAGASGSNLFGTAYFGSKGLLNGGTLLRVGGTCDAEEEVLYFGLHGGTGVNAWHWDWFEWWP